MSKQVIILHGVAERNPNYAAEFIKNLRPLVGDVIITPVFFGDIYQKAEDIFNAKLESNPLWKREHLLGDRGYINQFVQDMLQIRSHNINNAIAKRIYEATLKDHEIHVVTHSWGAVIFFQLFDVLEAMCSWRYVTTKVASVTTLGCAFHLYDLGQSTVTQKNWLNIYHTDDPVGIPLSTVYPCRDVEMKNLEDVIVGGEEIVLALQVHDSYWASKFVAEQVAEQVNVESHQ